MAMNSIMALFGMWISGLVAGYVLRGIVISMGWDDQDPERRLRREFRRPLGQQIRSSYDEENDILYIGIGSAQSAEEEEIENGVYIGELYSSFPGGKLIAMLEYLFHCQPAVVNNVITLSTKPYSAAGSASTSNEVPANGLIALINMSACLSFMMRGFNSFSNSRFAFRSSSVRACSSATSLSKTAIICALVLLAFNWATPSIARPTISINTDILPPPDPHQVALNQLEKSWIPSPITPIVTIASPTNPDFSQTDKDDIKELKLTAEAMENYARYERYTAWVLGINGAVLIACLWKRWFWK